MLCSVVDDGCTESRRVQPRLVFDFTTASTTETSRLEARRLGLEGVFEEYNGETGTVLVVDAASKGVRQAVHGVHDAATYRAAIDATLATARE